MNVTRVFVASAAAFLIHGSCAANAGQSIDEAGAIVCVNDKATESEPEKGHKLIDLAQ